MSQKRPIGKTISRDRAEPSSLMMKLVDKRREGHAAQLLNVTQGQHGSTSFSLSLQDAPFPTRKYLADLAAIRQNGSETQLIFAQKPLFAEGVDTALVLYLNPFATTAFAKMISDLKDPSAEKIAENLSIQPIPLIEIGSEPKEVAKLPVSFAAVAISGWDVCIDFYRASPYAFRRAQQTKEMDLEAVVRVDMNTGLYLSVARRISEIARSQSSLLEEQK